jgi:protein-disulfide isomerase
MRPFARRTVLVAAATLALAACGGNKGGGATDLSQDMSIGQPNAPVTVIEYASVTCPHCAAWNEGVFPDFKKKYVDTGKVRYVMRETNIHGAPDVAGYLLARCAPKEKYFDVIDGIMRAQNDLGQQFENTRSVYGAIARSVGMSDAQFSACITDPKKIEALNERMAKQQQEFEVGGTPTFIINGKKMGYTAPPTLDEISADIDPLLAKK